MILQIVDLKWRPSVWRLSDFLHLTQMIIDDTHFFLMCSSSISFLFWWGELFKNCNLYHAQMAAAFPKFYDLCILYTDQKAQPNVFYGSRLNSSNHTLQKLRLSYLLLLICIPWLGRYSFQNLDFLGYFLAIQGLDKSHFVFTRD